MKDIDPKLKIKASQKNIVSYRENIDAFILAFQDLIETKPSENPENPERGTFISEYLQDNIGMLNAIIIQDIIKRQIRNYLLDDWNIDEASVQVIPDIENGEYVVNVPVLESDGNSVNRVLEIVIEVLR